MYQKRASSPWALLMLIAVCVAVLAAGCAAGEAVSAPSAPPVTPAPTAAPTETPTPSPTPSPTPIPPVGDAYYDDFFNGAIFVGDSITQNLRNYAIRARLEQPTLLGDARFYASAKYGLQHAASTYKRFLYFEGNSYTLPELIMETGAEKVFIMLGLNNWAGTQIERCVDFYQTAVENMRAVNPDIQIYIQSCTPVVTIGQFSEVNNENVDAFNAALRIRCEEIGVHYVDVSTPLKDETNGLPRAYSKDNYVHMNPTGAAAWVDALYQYAYEATASGEKPQQ